MTKPTLTCEDIKDGEETKVNDLTIKYEECGGFAIVHLREDGMRPYDLIVLSEDEILALHRILNRVVAKHKLG